MRVAVQDLVAVGIAVALVSGLGVPRVREGPSPLPEAVREAESIERCRKGAAVIRVVDGEGKPVPGLSVTYSQVSHDFLFGVGMTSPKGGYPLSLYETLRAGGINYASPWLSWGHLEPTPGQHDWAWAEGQFMPEPLRQRGYTLTGHVLVWLYDGYGNLPQDLKGLSFPQVLERVKGHVFQVVNWYKGSISYWTINEPAFPSANALGLTIDQWVEVVRRASAAVKRADSGARVMVNLWPRDWPQRDYYPHAFLKRLIQEEVPFDAIGLELYPNAAPQDSDGYPQIDWLSGTLHSYGAYGKAIFLSEIGVPNRPSEDSRGRWLRQVYTLAFSKPYLRGATWYFVTDDPFLSGGGLLEDNYQPRPAFQTLQSLITSWTTGGSGTTDDQGILRFRGFAGNYSLSISGYGPALRAVHVAEDAEATYTLSTAALAPSPESPARSLGQCRPRIYLPVVIKGP